MAGREELEFVVKADDQATKTLDAVTKKVDKLEGDKATVKVDADTSGVSGKLDGLKTSLGNIVGAKGPLGKLQALGGGISQAFGGAASGLGSMIPVAGAAAGAVALLTKALDKFQETARTARDVGAATGLGGENASRWVAVADDFGVSAESLAAGVGKIGKSIDNSKWADYGIATKDAGGRARDANEVLLDTLDVLGKIPDGNARVQAGNDLLGKSWQGLAPMIGATREELEGYLDSVESGQVITDEEQRKAEEMRKAQDALGDAFGEIELAVGSLVAGLSPLITALAKVVGFVGEVIQAALSPGDPALELLDKMVKASADAGLSVDEMRKKFEKFGAENVEDSFKRVGIATEDVGEASRDSADLVDEMKHSLEEEAAAAQESANRHRDNVKALDEQTRAMRASADAGFALTDSQVAYNDTLAKLPKALEDAGADVLKQKQAYDDLAQAAGKVADSTVRVAEETANAEGKTLSATEKLDIMNHSLLTQASQLQGPQRQAILDYIGNINGIPPEMVSNIAAILDTGSVTNAETALDTASEARDSTITAEAETKQAEADIKKVADAKYKTTITADFIANLDNLSSAYARQVGKIPVKSLSAGPITKVSSASSPMSFAAPAGRSQVIHETINVNLPRGARHTDIARAMNRSTRRSGRRYGNPQVHHARR